MGKNILFFAQRPIANGEYNQLMHSENTLFSTGN
jgi:hypothetical protein